MSLHPIAQVYNLAPLALPMISTSSGSKVSCRNEKTKSCLVFIRQVSTTHNFVLPESLELVFEPAKPGLNRLVEVAVLIREGVHVTLTEQISRRFPANLASVFCE
jgi:hypothetical protein